MSTPAQPSDSAQGGTQPRGPAIPARDAALWVARQLSAAGHRALFAGGCVRDRLLGIDPTDYDVATSATPDHVRQVFPRAMGVGESFGVMLVRHGGRTVEVATFRSDGPYDDGRRPTEIRFASDREDALRRDFTVNGLFEEPETGAVIDHVGGRADLEARVLRAIGDARQRFREDRLRALRAARFAARFGLSIESDTVAAVREFAHDLGAVSRERIGHEVRRMLAHRTRVRAVELCESLGLAPVMLNEPVSGLAMDVLGALPDQAAIPTALAAWMLARTCQPADRSRVRAWRKALLLSNEETDALEGALHLRERLVADWAAGDAAARKRMAADPAFESALQLIAASHPHAAQSIAAELPGLRASGVAPEPFVNGDDLVALGLLPGRVFKAILEDVYDRQLNGEFSGREAALRALEAVARGAPNPRRADPSP